MDKDLEKVGRRGQGCMGGTCYVTVGTFTRRGLGSTKQQH